MSSSSSRMIRLRLSSGGVVTIGSSSASNPVFKTILFNSVNLDMGDRKPLIICWPDGILFVDFFGVGIAHNRVPTLCKSVICINCVYFTSIVTDACR